MKTVSMLTICVLALGLIVFPVKLTGAEPMGTAFTYQGVNQVEDGLYDFEFKLYRHPKTLMSLGSVVVDDVNVINGYFTAELDFGNVYDGNALWLEIGVRPGEQNDPNTYTTLSPRQEVMPTPYALYARSAQTAGTDNDWMVSDNNMYSIPTGNVGIGTKSPEASYKLTVDGGGSHYGIKVKNVGDIGIESIGSNYGLRASGGSKAISAKCTSGTGYAGYFDGKVHVTDNVHVTGNVGIGTNDPKNKLDVEGGIVVGASYSGTNIAPSNGMIIEGKVGIGTKSPEIPYTLTVDGGVGYYGIKVKNVGDIGIESIATHYGLIASGGKAVIGTGSSAGGDFRADAEGGRGVYGTASNSGDFCNYGGYFEAAGGYGRGVYGTASNSGDFCNYGGYFEAAGGHGQGVYGTASNSGDFTNYGGYFEAAGGHGQGVYGTASNSGDVTNYGGYFVAVGKYGRGIYAKGGPEGYAGEFNGTVSTKILKITGGSDLSEQFDVRGISDETQPSAGMVVSIDSESPGDLVVSTNAYDRRVAGIISRAGGIQPGMLMGQEGSDADGEKPVALTGRVYCWADASKDSIQPGDLLTTSDTPGHAMKVTDYTRAQGAILGKAMSSLESGRGQVLVLVTLQ